MIHIACAADENFAPHCAAMIRSVFECNRPDAVTVYFLHGPRLAKDVRNCLEKLVNQLGGTIIFLEIPDGEVEGLQPKGRVAGVMWYRVFLPERLEKLDRILYLDADTLVVDSLEPLWTTDLEGYYGAAVSNVLDPEYRRRPAIIGLANEKEYFNSGVLLMNLEAMRRDGVSERVCEVARGGGDKLMWQDQEPLNIVFAGKWRKLHPRWNCQNSLFYSAYAKKIFGADSVIEARLNPGIIHFEGPALAKPWHYLSKHPYKSAYLRYRSETPWSSFVPEGRTWKNRLLKPFPTNLTVNILKFEWWLRQKVARFTGRSKVSNPAVH